MKVWIWPLVVGLSPKDPVKTLYCHPQNVLKCNKRQTKWSWSKY